MAGANVPVLESVRAALGFWRFSTPRVAGVLAAVLAANFISVTATGAPLRFGFGLIGVLMGVIANAALLRLAFADEHGDDPEFRIGPGGFQWGRPETRLLGATLLLAFLLFIAILFLIVLAVICGAADVAVGDHGGGASTPSPALRLVVGLLAFALALVGIWLGVRVALYPAATVAEKRLMVFSTWGLTRGQFWRIFAAIVLVLSPTIVLTAVLTNAPLPNAVSQALRILLEVVNAFLEVPLVCGLYAYLYRGLRPIVAAPPAGALSPAA